MAAHRRAGAARDLDIAGVASETMAMTWWTTFRSKYLCKKFVYAFLTALGMGAALFGLHVDVMHVLLMATPFMIGIGAEGWTEAARVTSANALVMHKMSLDQASKALRLYPPETVPEAEPLSAPVIG